MGRILLTEDMPRRGFGLDALADEALRLTGAERALVLLRNGSPKLRIVAARGPAGQDLDRDGLRFSTSVATRVFEAGRAEALIDPSHAAAASSIVDLHLRRVMCAPLRSAGQLIGVLYADSRITSKSFDRADLKAFQKLAHRCGDVVERQRMADSLEEASRLQRALQPRRPEGGPRLEVAGLNRPLEEAGGDYLDYIRMGPRLNLVLGDVAGHGVAAALMMTAARSLLRAFLPREPDPAHALTQVNRSLLRDMPPGNFMSMFLAEFDKRTGNVRYVSAGHNAAFVLRADTGGTIEELPPTGPALGVVEQPGYGLHGVEALDDGDLLLAYSDGLTEAQGAYGEMFGQTRLMDLLSGLRQRTAPEIVSGITAAVTRFAGRSGPGDDCTLLVVKGR
ncbi:MAG: PP2C family protein-serine/threonine phosphatase [Planctomycetota bacterium]|jgi:hypothetical protein